MKLLNVQDGPEVNEAIGQITDSSQLNDLETAPLSSMPGFDSLQKNRTRKPRLYPNKAPTIGSHARKS